MNDQPIPTGAIRSSFDRAAQAHDAARTRGVGQPHNAPHSAPLGASRQIASPASVQAPPTVEQAIANASRQTSVDFDFLIAQAQVESAMNPEARARTSSATGLYQFIESTWLGTMQRHGERFGLGNVAAQISTTSGGNAYVADPSTRQAILEMRNDPEIASLMAAGLAEDNRAHLAPILGRQPEHNELYLAHFLGAGGAGRFLSEMAQNPDQSAASLFRRPAAANRPVFFERNGSPRSLAGVMDYLSGKLERARANAPTTLPQGYPGQFTQSYSPSYSAAPLAPPAYAAQPASPPVTPPPYVIADEGVFGPQNPPVLTGRARLTISASPPLSLAPTSNSGPRGSMSGLLQSTFAEAGSGSQSNGQIQRAYNQLRALGL